MMLATIYTVPLLFLASILLFEDARSSDFFVVSCLVAGCWVIVYGFTLTLPWLMPLSEFGLFVLIPGFLGKGIHYFSAFTAYMLILASVFTIACVVHDVVTCPQSIGVYSRLFIDGAKSILSPDVGYAIVMITTVIFCPIFTLFAASSFIGINLLSFDSSNYRASLTI